MAINVKRLTQTTVQKLQTNETVRDTDVKGFGVRKQKGQPSYFLQTYINGRLRWITIGKHGSPWTLTIARKEARRLLSDIAAGIDPGLEKRKKKEIPDIKKLAEEFLEEHGHKLRPVSLREYKRYVWNYIIPEFGKYKVTEIDKQLVSRAHNKWKDKPRSANFALAVMSKLMSWAEEQALRPEMSNPCRGIKKFPERKVERYLSAEEFQRLGDTLHELERNGSEDVYVIAAIRLLMFTGARHSEILHLTWSEVNMEQGILFLKQSKTGQKPIFLNKPASKVIASIPRLADNPYVIVGRTPGRHLINLQKPWSRIRKLADIEDVRLHDLRHSFASLAAGSGASLPLIGGLLGHSQPQTTARYAHLADNPLKEVNEKVGEKLQDIMKNTKKYN